MTLGERAMKLTYYEQALSPGEQRQEGSGLDPAIGTSGEIPVTDSPSQITLEGISGMVVMDKAQGSDAEQQLDGDGEGMLPYDEEDIRKGESGGASSSSSSDHVNTADRNEEGGMPGTAGGQDNMLQSNTLRPTLDLDTIRIDEKELHELSKSSREQQEKRTSMNNEFNT